jgi:nucleoside-diphosphate-sugar epimerase
MLELALALAANGRFERFAYIGTAFVAGRRTGVVYEHEVDVGQAFTNTYEQSKLEAEKLVRVHADELPITVLRPSIVAGRTSTGETSSFKVLYWPLKVFARRLIVCIPADPEAMYDIVPVDFVVEALLHILERKDSVGGCFHLTAGQAVTLDRAVRMAADIFDVRRVPPYVSPRRFYALVRPVLWLTLVGPMRRVLKTADVYIPYLSKKLIFDNRATSEALRGSDIRMPDVGAYLKTIFSYAKATDFGSRSADA